MTAVKLVAHLAPWTALDPRRANPAQKRHRELSPCRSSRMTRYGILAPFAGAIERVGNRSLGQVLITPRRMDFAQYSPGACRWRFGAVEKYPNAALKTTEANNDAFPIRQTRATRRGQRAHLDS
jgi:hypothetical protein